MIHRKASLPHVVLLYRRHYKSNQINLRLFDGKKYHDCHRRKSGLQTTYYSVDSVTATDMRNVNKVKKILSFVFSIYGSEDKVSIVLFRE